MTVFSTRDLEDVLKPIAYYIILDFVWTKIKKDLKKRILIVEEAWSLLQDEDSARFIYGVAKRARKYYLGLTTISQDVQDFLGSDFGKAIVTNSSIQILLKQHPAAIDQVAETFYLSEGEKRLLLSADKGEGLFFAGANHVSISVKASEDEYKLITTNPEELLQMRQGNPPKQQKKPTYKPVERYEDDKREQAQAQKQQAQTQEPQRTEPIIKKEPQITQASPQAQQPQRAQQNQGQPQQPAQNQQTTPQDSGITQGIPNTNYKEEELNNNQYKNSTQNEIKL